MSLYYLNIFTHVLAAMVWLGGMLFLAAVGAPVLRKVEPPELRATLFKKLGEQFRWVGWLCIVLLLVTGVVNLHYRGLLTRWVWTRPDFWTTSYGFHLAAKIVLVVVMLGIQAFHDFWHGPAASEVARGSQKALRLRTQAAWMARVNAILGLALIWVAVRLARGG